MNTAALPAATMCTMLPLGVGMECVLGVTTATTPKGVYCSSVIPGSPLAESRTYPVAAIGELVHALHTTGIPNPSYPPVLNRVAILFDAGSEEWSPQDVAAVVENVHEVRDVLRRRGHEVELLPVRHGDFRWLSRVRRADLVFNLCEGINGHARFEDLIVGTLELTGVPFTGCRTWPTAI